MMNIRVLCLALLVFAGCAKKGSEDYNVREQESFDLWMERAHPTAQRQASGIYIERLGLNGKVNGWSGSENGTPVSGTSWIAVDYLSRDIAGNIIATRNEAIAKNEGTFTRVTHYVPHFAKFDTSAGFFTQGEYEALSNMTAGDSVRLWLPTMMGYGTASISFANGYEGWRYSSKNLEGQKASGYGNKAVSIELALREIVAKPDEKELAEVDAAAATEGMALLDAEKTGQYFKITHEGVMLDENGDPILGNDLLPKPANVIAEDATIYIKYICRFLSDGKLLATNDAEVALVEWESFGDIYSGATSFIGTSSTLIGSALNNLFKSGKVRYGSTVEMIFTSTYGLGTSGKTASAGSSTAFPNPVVYPYTPLRITIEVKPEGYTPV